GAVCIHICISKNAPEGAVCIHICISKNTPEGAVCIHICTGKLGYLCGSDIIPALLFEDNHRARS
ncbi:hypothetical protein AVEN_121301-1, partial [Araneus ventricosus]